MRVRPRAAAGFGGRPERRRAGAHSGDAGLVAPRRRLVGAAHKGRQCNRHSASWGLQGATCVWRQGAACCCRCSRPRPCRQGRSRLVPGNLSQHPLSKAHLNTRHSLTPYPLTRLSAVLPLTQVGAMYALEALAQLCFRAVAQQEQEAQQQPAEGAEAGAAGGAWPPPGLPLMVEADIEDAPRYPYRWVVARGGCRASGMRVCVAPCLSLFTRVVGRVPARVPAAAGVPASPSVTAPASESGRGGGAQGLPGRSAGQLQCKTPPAQSRAEVGDWAWMGCRAATRACRTG